jgi:hypothetical protein
MNTEKFEGDHEVLKIGCRDLRIRVRGMGGAKATQPRLKRAHAVPQLNNASCSYAQVDQRRRLRLVVEIMSHASVTEDAVSFQLRPPEVGGLFLASRVASSQAWHYSRGSLALRYGTAFDPRGRSPDA